MKIDRLGPGRPAENAEQVAVPMRDGVHLAADLYLPTGAAAPVPAVLVRLPYDKNGSYCFMEELATHITGRGYAAVIQDVRGKFRSEGETVFAIHEVDDGYDTVDWVARQDWCDGSVTMWGDSYFGLTQLAAAASGHPSLRAIAPRLTGTQLANVVTHAAGTTTVDQTSRRAYFATHFVGRDTYDWPMDFTRRPLADGVEEFFTELGTRSPSYDLDLKNPAGLGVSIEQLLHARPVPTLFTVGQYDNCAVWSWADLTALLADPTWSAELHIRFEAIDHENYRRADVPITSDNDHTQSAAARAELIPRILDPALDFFDHILGRQSASSPPRVAYQVVNDRWHSATQWPPAGSRAWTLHAVAGDDDRTAVLTELRPADGGSLRWTSDGVHPVPSIAENPFALMLATADLSAVADRNDVVTATSSPVDHDVVLIGEVELTGSLTATLRSVDLFARLLDVSPQGEATLIARGDLRLHGLDGEQQFRMSLLHVAYRLVAGHRIMLHLAGSDYPEYTLNPGDGSDPWLAVSIPAVTTTLRLGTTDGLTLHLRTAAADD
ncbi:CocE/NonD family hydrolase [Actinoplanes sp. NPDC000266]